MFSTKKGTAPAAVSDAVPSKVPAATERHQVEPAPGRIKICERLEVNAFVELRRSALSKFFTCIFEIAYLHDYR